MRNSERIDIMQKLGKMFLTIVSVMALTLAIGVPALAAEVPSTEETKHLLFRRM